MELSRTRLLRMRRMSRGIAPAHGIAMMLSVMLATNSIGKNSSLSRSTLRPRAPCTMKLCPMCGPKFCSMNYSSKVDEYNKQVHGLEKKDYSELVEKLVAIK